MPYRNAHWFLLILFPLAGLAFWQNYLSQIVAAPPEMHAHGITATLWLLLLIVQSWTIHHGWRPFHRTLGSASLILFPLFLAGGITIFLGMAQRFAGGVSPFYTMYAAKLAWIDLVTVAAFAWLYFEALRQRRKTQLHARYMLATALLLMPPILGRLAPALPPLAVNGPADFWKLGIGFQLANAITAAIGGALALRSGRYGRPFLLATGATLLGALLFALIGPLTAWERLFAQAAALPVLPLAFAAGLAGAGIAYAGWVAGHAPERAEDAVAA
jgi:hypothetical protein